MKNVRLFKCLLMPTSHLRYHFQTSCPGTGLLPKITGTLSASLDDYESVSVVLREEGQMALIMACMSQTSLLYTVAESQTNMTKSFVQKCIIILSTKPSQLVYAAYISR